MSVVCPRATTAGAASAAPVAFCASAQAQLTTSQVTTITTAIDFATVLVGVAAAAAAIIVVLVACKGAMYLLGLLGGDARSYYTDSDGRTRGPLD